MNSPISELEPIAESNEQVRGKGPAISATFA
jgi:hypothetical protein